MDISSILMASMTPFMLTNTFQSFLVTAEKPDLGLKITVAAGLTNIILDYFFIGVFRWGLIGAASATGISQLVGGILPLLYFMREYLCLILLYSTWKWSHFSCFIVP